VQQCGSWEIAFLRGSVREAFSWPLVQLLREAVAVVLSELCHALPLGEILSEQSVGVLAGPPLPCVVGSGEVESSPGHLLDGGVVMELGAIVGGDGVDRSWLGLDQALCPCIDLCRPSDGELADGEVSGLPFHHGQDTGGGLSGAEERVDFPMSHQGASLGRVGSRGDVPFPGQPSATVVGAVAFSALLSGAPQVGVEVATCGLVGPDIAVDGLVTDREPSLGLEAPGDLFGAPEALEAPGHQAPVLGFESAIAAGAGSSTPGVGMSHLGSVGAVMGGEVAAQFAADCATMPSQEAGDGGGSETLPLQQSECVSFFKGDLVIAHSDFPLLLENGGTRGHPRSPFPFWDAVALSI
jgi:hypothetical protein